jgi:diguanylate cyclase (GGDEF)-like protein
VQATSRGNITTKHLRLLLILALVVVALALPASQPMRRVDNLLTALRFEHAPREATKKIVFIAIDKKSLDQVGVWPWPRTIHAQLLDNLVKAGVADIFFDVDFSTPSNPENDRRLAKALGDAGGGVILPVFQQHQTVADDSRVVSTRPIDTFSDQAWLASVNVAFDNDGMIRDFELGHAENGTIVQSASSVLAATKPATGFEPVDFSIMPSSVPTFSAADILSGRIEADKLRGRSIVIGAYAAELKDIFAVPVYGVLSGPMINILGAETLLQGRILRETDLTPLLLLLSGVLIVAALVYRSRPLLAAIISAVVAGSMLELAAFLAQKYFNVICNTGTSWVLLMIGLVMIMNEKVDLSALIADFAGAEQRNTRRILQRVVTQSADAVIVFDDLYQIVEASNSACEMFDIELRTKPRLIEVAGPEIEVALRDLVGKMEIHGPDACSCAISFARYAAEAKRYYEASLTLSPSENGIAFKASTSFVGCIIVRDITARMEYEEKLEQLSRYDFLTGLLNRRQFVISLDELRRPSRVIAINLHRFSVLNATLGRSRGDDLLKNIGQRLASTRGVLLACRLGGDSFGVAVDVEGGNPIEWDAANLRSVIDKPFDLEDVAISTTARLGICDAMPGDGDASQWVMSAEFALDEAKKVAGAGWRTYEPSTELRQNRSRRLEKDMKVGLSNGEFYLLYQPQVALETGELIGAEALIRWAHPELGQVSPAEFIPIAEANGFICDLGHFALHQACQDAVIWPADMTVAVNISSIQFARADLVSDTTSAIRSSGLGVGRLHLEITESAFAADTDVLIRTLSTLRDLGFLIALDDFGTGYSSMSYIANFPLDKLKVDQSFVRRMAGNARIKAIVEAVVTLAHALGLEIVAEGIELQVEREMLMDLHCEIGQGYLFGKPMSSADLMILRNAANQTRLAS